MIVGVLALLLRRIEHPPPLIKSIIAHLPQRPRTTPLHNNIPRLNLPRLATRRQPTTPQLRTINLRHFPRINIRRPPVTRLILRHQIRLLSIINLLDFDVGVGQL